MRRGTTPTITLHIDGANLDDLGTTVVTLKQGRVIFDVPHTIEGDEIHVTLTQEQTLATKHKSMNDNVTVHSIPL